MNMHWLSKVIAQVNQGIYEIRTEDAMDGFLNNAMDGCIAPL